MSKAEYRKKVHELVDYMLGTNDNDLIKHYDDMMWELVEEISQEVALKFYDWMCSDMGIRLGQHVDLTNEEWFNDWKFNQENK